MQNTEIILVVVFINYICFYVVRERYCEEYCNYKIYNFIRSNEKLHEAVAVCKQEEEQKEEARKIGGEGSKRGVKFNKRTYSALISRNL